MFDNDASFGAACGVSPPGRSEDTCSEDRRGGSARRRAISRGRAACRQAVEQLRHVRPANLRALEQADADEQLLKDLVRKLALYKSSLGSEADAERLIAASQAEIERTRQQTRAELEEISREVEEARRELRTATDQYRQLRRELDRLQPELAAQFWRKTVCSGMQSRTSPAASSSSWATKWMPVSMRLAD